MLAVGALGGIGRLGLVAAAVRQLFDPRSLFTAGEQGVWYDPSDLSTLFQDSAGTVPVTGVEQPVGRMLDKSGRGNHAFQSTAIDRPILRQDAGGRYFLAANGTNTWMQTNSIDFTGTDKVTVFAGVRKLSDATISVLAELSSSSDTNAGVLLLSTGSYQTTTPGPAWTSRSKGSATSFAVATVSAAPVSNVVSLSLGISDARNIVRVNGAQLAQSASGQGAGNYGNYPLFLFRRNGNSLPANIQFHGLLIRGALTSDPQTVAMERWLAPKTGVTL